MAILEFELFFGQIKLKKLNIAIATVRFFNEI